MTMRDRLAATLINHWYVIERALAVHRIQKVPTAKEKYQALDELEKLPPKEYDAKVAAIVEEFASYNSKSFAANIAHVIENDAAVVDYGAKVACSKLKTTLQTVVTVSSKISDELEAISKSLKGPEQDANLKKAISTLPTIAVGTEFSTFTIKTACSSTSFKSLFDVETDFIAEWNAIKMLLAIHKNVLPLLSETNKKEVLAGRAFINIKDSKFKDGLFSADKFEVAETPEAKSAREVRERLEAALNRRIKSIKGIGIGANAVTYSFEDNEVPPFKVDLDVVTHW